MNKILQAGDDSSKEYKTTHIKKRQSHGAAFLRGVRIVADPAK